MEASMARYLFVTLVVLVVERLQRRPEVGASDL
jgi:hypothetical protein